MITSTRLDQAAIGLSALCVLHCLALPVLLVLVPSLATLPVADEHFHEMLVYVVLPTSLIALFLGCRQHRRVNVLGWGLVGVAILVFAAVFGHDVGELFEKSLTVLGAVLVAIGHTLNFRQCRQADCTHDA